MRRLSACFLVATVSLAWAGRYAGPGPVTEFPARYSDRMTAVYDMAATNGSRSAHKTMRKKFSDVLVFDDATTLHFEGDDSEPFQTVATWRAVSARDIRFTYTQETMDAADAYLRGEIGTLKRFRLRVFQGKLRFARDGSSYRGTQAIRATGRVRNVWFTLNIRGTYRGTRQ